MNALMNGLLDHAPVELNGRAVRKAAHRPAAAESQNLRRVGWEVGERRAAESYAPSESHVGLAPVSPGEGFTHWRILDSWVDATARGDAWRDCRLVLRLYDISFIGFNGHNAHPLYDFPLPALSVLMYLKQPRPAATQLGEVGFLLRNGEFIPAARSRATPFPLPGPSPHAGHAGLYVDGRGRVEEIGNVWDQERILNERGRPRLRGGVGAGRRADAAILDGGAAGQRVGGIGGLRPRENGNRRRAA